MRLRLLTALFLCLFGFMVIIDSGDCLSLRGCAQVAIFWNDSNLRLSQLQVTNTHVWSVCLQVFDEAGVLIIEQAYAPGITTQNIPGGPGKWVTIIPAEGQPEIEFTGIGSLRFLDPAPPDGCLISQKVFK